jgi:hypothetical protein
MADISIWQKTGHFYFALTHTPESPESVNGLPSLYLEMRVTFNQRVNNSVVLSPLHYLEIARYGTRSSEKESVIHELAKWHSTYYVTTLAIASSVQSGWAFSR